MSGFLLDTNVVSEVIKPVQDAVVMHWLEQQDESLLFLSVLTLGEIRKGISRLPEGPRRSRLEAWLTTDLCLRFQDRILIVNQEIAQLWGRLQATGREFGRPLPVIDSLLLATALHHDLVFVTRNVRDTSLSNVQCLNPWEGAG